MHTHKRAYSVRPKGAFKPVRRDYRGSYRSPRQQHLGTGTEYSSGKCSRHCKQHTKCDICAARRTKCYKCGKKCHHAVMCCTLQVSNVFTEQTDFSWVECTQWVSGTSENNSSKNKTERWSSTIFYHYSLVGFLPLLHKVKEELNSMVTFLVRGDNRTNGLLRPNGACAKKKWTCENMCGISQWSCRARKIYLTYSGWHTPQAGWFKGVLTAGDCNRNLANPFRQRQYQTLPSIWNL